MQNITVHGLEAEICVSQVISEGGWDVDFKANVDEYGDILIYLQSTPEEKELRQLVEDLEQRIRELEGSL